MPNYLYSCLKCKKEFEQVNTMKDRDKGKCACGSKAKRLITMPAVVYKTGGFTTRPERDVQSEINNVVRKET